MPEMVVLLFAAAEYFQLVVPVIPDLRGTLAHEQVHQIRNAIILVDSLHHFQGGLHEGLAFYLFFRVETIVAVPAVILVISFAEIVQQEAAAADRSLCVSSSFGEQLSAISRSAKGLSRMNCSSFRYPYSCRGDAFPSSPSRPARPVSWW